MYLVHLQVLGLAQLVEPVVSHVEIYFVSRLMAGSTRSLVGWADYLRQRGRAKWIYHTMVIDMCVRARALVIFRLQSNAL